MLIERAAPEDAAEIAHVHAAPWRETYSGILPRRLLGDLSVSLRADFWATELSDSSAELIVHLARLDTGEAVGFYAVGPERGRLAEYQGEVYALYLLPPTREPLSGNSSFCPGLSRLANSAAIRWLFGSWKPILTGLSASTWGASRSAG